MRTQELLRNYLNMFAKIVVLLLCAGSQLWICSAAHVPDLTIIRGVDARPHEVPSMVRLMLTHSNGGSDGCGGTLIHPQFVLTAAHCLWDIGSIQARLGCHLRDCSDMDQAIDHSEFGIHPDYVGDAAHDVGIVKLSKAATLKSGVVGLALMVEAAKLPSRNGYYNGRNATVYGWGRTESWGFPLVLRKLQGRIEASQDSNFTVWLGRKDGQPGVSCNGDSGGPLLWNGLQIGVVSRGAINCVMGPATMFPRVDYHRSWIDSYIKAH